jgi:hypothetical protein
MCRVFVCLSLGLVLKNERQKGLSVSAHVLQFRFVQALAYGHDVRVVRGLHSPGGVRASRRPRRGRSLDEA